MEDLDLRSQEGPLSHPPRFDFRNWEQYHAPPIYFMGDLPQDNVQNIKTMCVKVARDLLYSELEGPYYALIMFQQEVLALEQGSPIAGFSISTVPCNTPKEAYAASLAFHSHVLISRAEQRAIAAKGYSLQEPELLMSQDGTTFRSRASVPMEQPNQAHPVRIPTPQEMFAHLLALDDRRQRQAPIPQRGLSRRGRGRGMGAASNRR